MHIFAIDPGSTESAYVELDKKGQLVSFGQESNGDLLERVYSLSPASSTVVIEMIASYGMAVGAEVFETCVYIGRLWERSRNINPVVRVVRKEVKMHLCGSNAAKDANIRQALIDRWGGPQETKKGGSLYKVSNDVWAALALGVTFYDRQAVR